MAQVALKIEAPVNVAAQTFATAFEAFEVAVSGHAFNRSEAKESASALATAERAVSWAAVDLAAGDVDTLVRLAVQIATRKGVKEEAMRVVMQRARDVIGFWNVVGKAKRDKANPFTEAKKARENRAKVSEAAASNAPFIAEALELAAGALETSVPALQAQIMAGDSAAREALDAGLDEVKRRAFIVEDARKLAASLEHMPAEIAAQIKALFA